MGIERGERMIDIDRLELVDTGDGVPLSKCEQNLYDALANLQDIWESRDYVENKIRQATIKRLEDALTDMNELLAEVKRLRKLVDEHNEESWYQREWVEKLFENMGRSSADVAQAVENFQNYRGD